MYKNKIAGYVDSSTYPANDNEHSSIRVYRAIYRLFEQLETQNANLESLKAEIKADAETFAILDTLFTKVDLLKYHIEELV